MVLYQVSITRPTKLRAKIAAAGVIVLGIVPAVIMAWYALNQGGSNFQDDYGFYINHLAWFWNHGISFEQLLIRSPHGPHFTFLPLLFRVLSMKLGHWDAFLESYVSIALGVGRVALIYGIFAPVLPHPAQRYAVLLLASFLTFAPVQLGLYIYGDTGLTIGLDSFGFMLGLWGAINFRKTWQGAVLIALGGFISSWSWGIGAAWCIFLLAMLLYRFNWKQFVIVGAAFTLIHVPFAKAFLNGTMAEAGGALNLFNYRIIIGALGRPFAPDVNNIGDYAYANCIGIGGILIALLYGSGILRYVYIKRRIPASAIPGSLLIMYGLLCVYQASIVRTSVGPWYVALSVYFWIGLVGLAIAWIGLPPLESTKRIITLLPAAAVMLAVVVLYVTANSSFENKTPFIQERTLSSESCVRNYKIAPTFCEMLVFMWPPTYELASFSRFFEETQLSAFGTRQTWALQGDFVLNSVKLEEDPTLPQVQWIDPKLGYQRGRPANWQTHRRLSLYIPRSQKVNWTVHLPAEARSAKLKATINNPGKGLVTFVVVAQELGKSDEKLLQQSVQPGESSPLTLDLSAFFGRPVNIVLSVKASNQMAALVLEYPRIEVIRERMPVESVTERYRDIQSIPENTDLASIDQVPNTPRDVVLDRRKQVPWHELYENVIKPVGDAACVGDHRAIKVTMALPENITIRMVRVMVATRKANGDYFQNEIQLPLLMDGGLHTYTIDLKLLSLDKRNKVEAIRIYALSGAGTTEQQRTLIDVPEVRLVHNGLDRSFCT